MWGGHVWPQLLPAVNRAAGQMHQPTNATYRHAKHALMHVNAHPFKPRFGPSVCTSLVTADPPIPPHTKDQKEWGLHALVDANKEAPKSYTGVDIMLGGAVIDTTAIRQHHASTSVHDSEVHAACTAVAKLLPIRGLAHEMRVPQVGPSPMWFDSASTIFVVRDEMSMRRSAWLLGKVKFMQDASKDGEIDARKVVTDDNTADSKTKYVGNKTYWRHLLYTHNIPSSEIQERGIETLSDGNELVLVMLSHHSERLFERAEHT